MAEEYIGGIDKIGKVGKHATEAKVPAQQPNKDHFESLMNQSTDKKEATTVESAELAKKNEASLLDEVRDLNYKASRAIKGTPDELVTHAQEVISQIDELKNKLRTPDLELKSSVSNVLRSKLNHIDENLKVALTKVGAEYRAPERPTDMSTPIERFLGFLTHGQEQLKNIAGEVKNIHEKSGEFTPANMLLVQIKVSQVQQEIELFTSMLNKALESTKTIMNVQV